MLEGLRRHLGHNVIGYLALFVALGGTSYAVATGSVDSRAIKNNAVRSGDLRNNDVRGRDVRNRTLRARDIGPNALAGSVIDERRLAEVPAATRAGTAANATALGGQPSSAFVGGPGRVFANTIDVQDDNAAPATALTVPGYGTLTVVSGGCETTDPDEGLDMEYRNTSATSQDLFFLLDNPITTSGVHAVLPAGDAGPIGAGSSTGNVYEQIRIHPFGSATRAATITAFLQAGNTAGALTCRISSQVVLSG